MFTALHDKGCPHFQKQRFANPFHQLIQTFQRGGGRKRSARCDSFLAAGKMMNSMVGRESKFLLTRFADVWRVVALKARSVQAELAMHQQGPSGGLCRIEWN